MTTRAIVAAAIAIAALAVWGDGVSTEEGRRLIRAWLSWSCGGEADRVSQLPQAERAARIDAVTNLNAFASRLGWSREAAVHEMAVMATNGFARYIEVPDESAYYGGGGWVFDFAKYAEVPDDVRSQASAEGVFCRRILATLARNNETNALWALEAMWRMSPKRSSRFVFDAYARLAGFSHEALAFYSGTLSPEADLDGEEVSRALDDVMGWAYGRPLTAVETNRVLWLAVRCAGDPRTNPNLVDGMFAAFLDGYSASSNRLAMTESRLAYETARLDRHLSDCGDPSKASMLICGIEDEIARLVETTNQLTQARDALLALPEGALTWISTNQYYNVE